MTADRAKPGTSPRERSLMPTSRQSSDYEATTSFLLADPPGVLWPLRGCHIQRPTLRAAQQQRMGHLVAADLLDVPVVHVVVAGAVAAPALGRSPRRKSAHIPDRSAQFPRRPLVTAGGNSPAAFMVPDGWLRWSGARRTSPARHQGGRSTGPSRSRRRLQAFGCQRRPAQGQLRAGGNSQMPWARVGVSATVGACGASARC